MNKKKKVVIIVAAVFVVVALLLILNQKKKDEQPRIIKDSGSISIVEPDDDNVELTNDFYNEDLKKESKKETSREVKTIVPAFDVVRVEKRKAVFAGRADKNVDIHIMSGDKEIGTMKTDGKGEFVFIPEKDFDAGHYEFSLWYEKDGKKITSEQNAILAIDTKNNSGIAVLVGGDKETKVMTAPKGEYIGELAIQLVEYDFKDTMTASGTAEKNAKVNVYLDNKLLQTVTADEDGKWTLKYETTLIQDKAYKIRADQVNESGKVLKRVENRFSTEKVEVAKQYVVRKGDCLWRIARKEYGKGIKYTLIFEANKAQIKNPDLIYPNQIFKLPKNS